MRHRNHIQNPKSSRYITAQDDILSSSPRMDSGCDFIPNQGRPGFSKAISLIKRLIEAGLEDIDILIQLHEEVPQDIAQEALQHAKQRGLI